MPPIATPDLYAGTPGQPIYAGIAQPFVPQPPAYESLGAITIINQGAALPHTTPGQTLVLSLHASGSSGGGAGDGRRYSAEVAGSLAYDTYTDWAFKAQRGLAVDHLPGVNGLTLIPTDVFGKYASNAVRESYWMGFTGMGQPEMRLITERRVDALVRWANENLPISATRRCVTGGSMGAWGTLTYGIRRPDMFAALYPDRPRWRWSNYNNKTANYAHWVSGAVTVNEASTLTLSAEDGGGKIYDRLNVMGYAADPSNKIPWIGWCIGRSDGFSDFRDHVAAVAALRAAKRGFAFAWNDGTHVTGSILSQVKRSYPYGTFEIGKGYPLFTNHSGDQDPSIDLVGGINLGLSFRNVIESASGWSCQITSLDGPRTVTVEPISTVFTTPVTPEVISIPDANVWVSVTF